MIYIYTYMCVCCTYNFFKPLEIDEVFLGVFTSKHGSAKAQIFRSGEEEKDVVFWDPMSLVDLFPDWCEA